MAASESMSIRVRSWGRSPEYVSSDTLSSRSSERRAAGGGPARSIDDSISAIPFEKGKEKKKRREVWSKVLCVFFFPFRWGLIF